MKALVWNDKHSVSVEEVPDPKIEDPRDAIVRITTTCICGSDLHLYDGLVQTDDRPALPKGDAPRAGEGDPPRGRGNPVGPDMCGRIPPSGGGRV